MNDAVSAPIKELTVSQIWQAGWLVPDRLRTVTGEPVGIVYRGRWTFGFGPDFRGAMITVGAELRRGDVEIHLRESGWRTHGHHLNPAYNKVILHVVLDADVSSPPCVRQDGVEVPTIVLRSALRGPVETFPADPALMTLQANADECVAAVTTANRAAALGLLDRAGDARLTAKAARFEALFTTMPPAEVLYAGLLTALGYSRNQDGMASVAQTLPLAVLESRLSADQGDARVTAAALLLGVGGWLPFLETTALLSGLTVAEQHQITQAWNNLGMPWLLGGLATQHWQLARLRPANHPLRRLLGAAELLARCGRVGLLATCLDCCTSDEPAAALAQLQALLMGPPRPADPLGRAIGGERVLEILTNVVVPFALAYAAWTGDEDLSTGAASLWEQLPANAGNSTTRSLIAQLGGPTVVKLRTARQQQGALHLFQQYCEERRCYECPLARLSMPAE